MATPHILLAYHSAEGQTHKVVERIARRLEEGGTTVQVADASDAPGPAGFDAVVLGDSIHLGRHSRQLSRYVARHADEFDGVPVALFQVSLTSAGDDEEHTAEAHRLVHRLLDATGLDPDIVGAFAGALAYTRYGWLKRRLMRRIAADQGADTDTSVDHEYTDWGAVDHFAADVLVLVQGDGSAP